MFRTLTVGVSGCCATAIAAHDASGAGGGHARRDERQGEQARVVRRSHGGLQGVGLRLATPRESQRPHAPGLCAVLQVSVASCQGVLVLHTIRVLADQSWVLHRRRRWGARLHYAPHSSGLPLDTSQATWTPRPSTCPFARASAAHLCPPPTCRRPSTPSSTLSTSSWYGALPPLLGRPLGSRHSRRASWRTTPTSWPRAST